jgi:hypothetical protein
VQAQYPTDAGAEAGAGANAGKPANGIGAVSNDSESEVDPDAPVFSLVSGAYKSTTPLLLPMLSPCPSKGSKTSLFGIRRSRSPRSSRRGAPTSPVGVSRVSNRDMGWTSPPSWSRDEGALRGDIQRRSERDAEAGLLRHRVAAMTQVSSASKVASHAFASSRDCDSAGGLAVHTM